MLGTFVASSGLQRPTQPQSPLLCRLGGPLGAAPPLAGPAAPAWRWKRAMQAGLAAVLALASALALLAGK